MDTSSQSRLTDTEKRIMSRAREFDLGPLVRLLEAQGYPPEHILFESNPELGSAISLVEKVTFHLPPDSPFRRVVVTLNMGLLGPNALLPSYFLELVEQLPGPRVDERMPEPEDFFDFIRFFDHRLIDGFLRAVQPEQNTALIENWEKSKECYFRMLGLGSVATLQWFFQLYFPELRVKITRDAISEVTDGHPLRIGKSRLDGTAVLGPLYESDASGFRVELLTDDETDGRGEDWPPVVHRRLERCVLSLLAPARLRLVVGLTVLTAQRWARLDENGYLGFERLRGDSNKGYRMTLFDGNTGDWDPLREERNNMGMLYRKFLKGKETLHEDVQRNLSYLLRAKRGAASFHPLFGLSETGFRTAEEMLVRLSQEIRENIRLFEPRIELTEIEEDHDGEDGHARLVVNCRIKDTQDSLTVVFSPHGRTLSVGARTRPKEEG